MLHPIVIILALYVLIIPLIFMFCNNRELKRESKERKIHAPF